MSPVTEAIVYTILFVSLYFEVFLLITFFERFSDIRSTTQRRSPVRAHPRVSVIVPCYNEARTLAGTLNSLLALSYPQERLEIIVVDDGSSDETLSIARQFEHLPSVTVCTKANGGKHTALNEGLRYAAGEYIACLDADSYVTADALNAILPYFADNTISAVTPVIIPYRPRNLLELIQKAEYTMSIFIRRIFGFLNAQFVTPGPFSIYRASALAEVGPFRQGYNTEDCEMCMRLQAHGHRIENAHTAHVYTNVPNSFAKLFKQRVRWTYGFLKNAIDYRFMFFRRQYGYLGGFILPVTTFSIFGALFFFGLMLNGVIGIIADNVEYVQAIGWTLPHMNLSLSWFYITTDAVLFIIAAVLMITAGVISAGKFIAAEERLITKDMFLYLFLYGFIAPLWLGKSVWNAALSRESNWAAEHE
jgi:cellulose synthase/poly-beta-1,6-N-acetylglucosamine synthase-like glycosyltransferase